MFDDGLDICKPTRFIRGPVEVYHLRDKTDAVSLHCGSAMLFTVMLALYNAPIENIGRQITGVLHTKGWLSLTPVTLAPVVHDATYTVRRLVCICPPFRGQAAYRSVAIVNSVLRRMGQEIKPYGFIEELSSMVAMWTCADRREHVSRQH